LLYLLFALLDATTSVPPQRAVAVQLATSVYWEFLEQLAIHFDVDQMSA